MEYRNTGYLGHNLESKEASKMIINLIISIIILIILLYALTYVVGYAITRDAKITADEYERNCANAGLSGDYSNNNIHCKRACEKKGMEFGMTSRNTFEACICMDGGKPVQIY